MDRGMTRQQTFKRRVRSRMAATGESYAAARRQVLARANHVRILPPIDERHRRLLEWRRDRVRRTTGLSMEDWISTLDRAGGRAMAHRDLWRWLGGPGRLPEPATRAAVVVTYEQHIGRRQPGQSCDGDYPASLNRTLPGTPDEVLRRWLDR